MRGAAPASSMQAPRMTFSSSRTLSGLNPHPQPKGLSRLAHQTPGEERTWMMMLVLDGGGGVHGDVGRVDDGHGDGGSDQATMTVIMMVRTASTRRLRRDRDVDRCPSDSRGC